MRKGAAIFVFLWICTLCACGQVPINTSSATLSDSQVSDDTIMPFLKTSSSKVQLVTSPQGASQIALAKDGGYQLHMLESGGMVLNYIDYATKVRMPLCTRPDCKHKDDTCAAWFPQCGGILFMNSEKDRLFCVTYADAVQESTDSIWEISLDGSVRSNIYRLRSSENFVDAVAANKDHLFFTVRCFADATSNIQKQLYALDLESKEVYPIMKYGDADWLYGAFDHSIVILSYQSESTDHTFVYYIYDLISGEKREFYSYGYFSDGRRAISQTDGSSLFLINPTTPDLAEVTRIEMDSGEQTIICNNLPYYSSDTSFIQGIYDGKILVDITRADEKTREIDSHRYSVDCSSGEIAELSLTIQNGNLIEYLPVLGSATEEEFLVINGYEQHEIMLAGNDGTYYSTQVSLPRYAFINKNNYWSNIQKFDFIKDISI